MRLHAAPLVLLGILLAGCSKPAADGATTSLVPARDPAAVVARVDGAPVTEADLAAETKAPVAAAERKFLEEVHGQRARALDRVVERRLLEARAKKEGTTVEALLAREVTAKVQEPSEATLRAVYDQTAASGRPLPPFEVVKGEIAGFVKGQAEQELRQAFVGQLRAAAKVESLLPPLLLPKVTFQADGPSRGDAKAPVTVVEFSDYECPFCARAEPVVKQLLAEYPGRVRVVLQQFPLGGHPNAPKAAEAAFCAGEQGKYWEMHELLLTGQGALGVDALKGRARTLPIDAARFDACLDSGRMAPVVEASRKLGVEAGVDATPAFFVNGRPLSGAQPIEKFRELVDHELSAAGR
jgi:protein-disulfide isomerase